MENSTLGKGLGITEEDIEKISSMLDCADGAISPREVDVLRMRYGLGDGVPKTLDEVGAAFGITP